MVRQTGVPQALRGSHLRTASATVSPESRPPSTLMACAVHSEPATIPSVSVASIQAAILGGRRIEGLTHSLYRYPARFPPEFARAAIMDFSDHNDWVLDPFVGGGTSVVEALALGRRVAAIDLNPLAILLSAAKTTPLYSEDVDALRRWAESTAEGAGVPSDERTKNAPTAYIASLAPLVEQACLLATPRQRDLARALLLHVGQWALDGREVLVPPREILRELPTALDRHLANLRDFVDRATEHSLRPSDLARRRILREGDARSVASGRPWNRLAKRFRLVVTSPPYPSVHVLYHRWQVYGRAETALPYWLSGSNDGLGASHYTMGGRSTTGEDRYFATITASFLAVRRLLRPDGHVVQLVSFHRPATQMPRYMSAMEVAGYKAVVDEPVARDVPNRRWYYRVDPERGKAQEYLFVHSLAT